MSPLRVAILVHESDARAERAPYIAWALRDRWREDGLRVDVVFGVRRPVEADVVVNHVDATVVPDEYREFLAGCPRSVNGACVDISKRRVSRALLRPEDPWPGPVIVKTDANCGAIGDARVDPPRLRARALAAARRALGGLGGRARRERAAWRTRWRLSSESYPVFPSVAAVPDGVFENPALVVERFLPERDGPHYALRTYYPFGDRWISRRVLSTEPIVKSSGVVRRDDVPPHPEAIAVAARLGLDFGKVDYVVHGDEAFVLDVNRTPTFGPRLDEAKRRWTAEVLAPGLAALLARTGS
jgi:hypothetical protein